MNSSIRLETNVVAVDGADLLPPSSDYASPVVAGVETESTAVIWPFLASAILIVLILVVYKKICNSRA